MKRKWIISIFVFVGLFFLLTGLYWLAIPLFILAIFIVIIFGIIGIRRLRKFRWLKTAITFFLIFAAAIIFRVFFAEIFSIPSGSMEDTLMVGDKILVDKLCYGPELPRSPFEVPWINLLFFINKEARASMDSLWWDYRRFSGYSKISQGDVMVFRHPIWGDRSNYYIKRCVSLPGDTIRLKSGNVFINLKCFSEPPLVRKKYRIYGKNFFTLRDTLEKAGINISWQFFYKDKSGINVVSLTTHEKERIASFTQSNVEIDSITSIQLPNDSANWVHPEIGDLKWTIDDYGPIVTPYKGMTIRLTAKNFILYRQTINLLEKQKLENIDDRFLLNGVPVKSYTFLHDYYFMLGDNRYNSCDSRYWGFVPEENIVGKAKLVLFSNSDHGIKWKRSFKRIK